MADVASTPVFQRVVRIALSGLLALPQAVVPAATITVRGACTLPDAITAANRNAAVGACSAGSGADTIRLTADVDLIAADNADNGLPQISTKIEIQGRGFAIERNASGPPFRILDVLPSGNLTLDRVTVANGKTSTNGGGIRTLGTLTLKNSTVSGNESGNRGGGIYANGGGYTQGAEVTLVNSTVSRNTARRGAGITAYDYSRLTISGSTISNNVAVSRGGGILLHAAYTTTISNSTISSNSASSGAGIRATDYSALDITDTTISDNTSTRFEGGGIFSVDSDLRLTRSRVTGNSAKRGGGIFASSEYGGIGLRYSTISGNTAGEFGGGAFVSGYEGYFSLRNSTISGNSAATGGGLFHLSTYYRFETAINYSTISQNKASLGAGIYAMGDYADYSTLGSSLVAGNNGGNCAGPGLSGAGNNFDDDGTCPDAAAISPGVDFDTSLADNGGPTPTHALLEGSVAIDVGVDCSQALTDQRRFPRDELCDSGSFEFGAEGLGASVTGVANRKVFCKNLATRQKGKTRTKQSSWLCDDLGVTASSSERVLLWSIGIADGTAAVGGSVSGLDKSRKPRVVCRNKTRATKVAFASDTPSWNCEAEGLVVEPGDSIQQKIKGRV
ncbi:MAG: hypothetical protein GY769_10240 [bacterium]|nr:hypothetical protein [bacterium]